MFINDLFKLIENSNEEYYAVYNQRGKPMIMRKPVGKTAQAYAEEKNYRIKGGPFGSHQETESFWIRSVFTNKKTNEQAPPLNVPQGWEAKTQADGSTSISKQGSMSNADYKQNMANYKAQNWTPQNIADYDRRMSSGQGYSDSEKYANYQAGVRASGREDPETLAMLIPDENVRNQLQQQPTNENDAEFDDESPHDSYVQTRTTVTSRDGVDDVSNRTASLSTDRHGRQRVRAIDTNKNFGDELTINTMIPKGVQAKIVPQYTKQLGLDEAHGPYGKIKPGDLEKIQKAKEREKKNAPGQLRRALPPSKQRYRDSSIEYFAKLDEQDVEEGSVQDRLHRRHQELRKKSGLPDPDYYKELKASYDIEDDAKRLAQQAEIKKKYKVAEGISVVDSNYDLDQMVLTLDIEGTKKYFTYWDYDENFENAERKDVFAQLQEQPWYAGLDHPTKMEILDAAYKAIRGEEPSEYKPTVGDEPLDENVPSEEELEWQGREENRFPHFYHHKNNTIFTTPGGKRYDYDNPDQRERWLDLYKKEFDMPTPHDGGWWKKGPNGDEALVEQGVAEAGPFSYGAKKPRKGSVAYNAMMKRKEQEKNKKPIEPRDQMVGTAKVVTNEDIERYLEEMSRAGYDIVNEKKDRSPGKITKSEDPCWTGHHMVGKKKKNGRIVPNCVPGKKG